MHVHILYGTNSGGTQSACEIVAGALRKNYRLTLTRADNAPARAPRADLVLLASCTWERFEGRVRLEGQLQQHMYAYTERQKDDSSAGQLFAILGLGDASYTNVCAAADRLEGFVRRVGGRLLLPSLRIEGFYYDLDRNRDRCLAWAEKIKRRLRRHSV